jgi:hypothetical protein
MIGTGSGLGSLEYGIFIDYFTEWYFVPEAGSFLEAFKLLYHVFGIECFEVVYVSHVGRGVDVRAWLRVEGLGFRV